LGASFTDVPGGTANWSFSGGTNYNDAVGSVAIDISKANASINVTGYTGVYDAAAHGATGTATGVGGVNLSAGLNLGASFTDVPGGTANWTFSGGTNYNDAVGSVAIDISKANASINVTGYTGVYDAAAHGATGTATGVGGADLSAGLDLGASFTDVPGGTANWTFSGGTNYNDAAGSVAIDISKATPSINWSNPAAITYGTALGATQLNATASVPGSFIYTPAAGTILTAGSHTLTVNFSPSDATNYDNASAQVQITVNPWAFSGFRQPVDNLPTVNRVKAGSAIPVKFSLSGNKGLNIFYSGYPKSTAINCDTQASLDDIETTVTAGSSSLSYDALADQYNYVWKTEASWAGTCRQLTVKLMDGTLHQANFKFTK